MIQECAPRQTAADGRERLAGEDALRRTMVRVTLAYWAGIYMLFTLRAVFRPHPFFLTQAGLRAVMMLVGISLCGALYVLLNRIDGDDFRRRLGAILPLTAAATVAYVCINYLTFYVVPGLWEPRNGPWMTIGGYLIELVWVFAAWVLLYLWARNRHGRAAAVSGNSTPIRHLWVRQREAQVCVPIDAIEWIEAEGDYVRISTPGRSHLMRSTMRAMEEMLDRDRFVRVHRRVIVPVALVEALERRPGGGWGVKLSTGARLPVGRSYRRQLEDVVVSA